MAELAAEAVSTSGDVPRTIAPEASRASTAVTAASRSATGRRSTAPGCASSRVAPSPATAWGGPATATGRSLGSAVTAGQEKASTRTPTTAETPSARATTRPQGVCGTGRGGPAGAGAGASVVDDMAVSG
ncbi:hypothetical protein ACQFYA_08640 [Promicromonospora sp. Marseille-Q5078]